ncbi:MAG: M43 family zinc metalloprotease [Bacteroidota bacterium]
MKTNIFKISNQFFLFVLLILFSGFSGEDKKIASLKTPVPGDCDNTNSNTNPDYINKYKKIETYIPDENTAIKHIKIAVNIFTGPGTIQNTPASVAEIRQMIEWLNGFYTNVDSATYPIAGALWHKDTKIRFDLDERIFFYEETTLYNNTSQYTLERHIATVDSARLDNLNIYITAGGKASPYSIPPYPRFILKDGGDITSSSLYANQGVYISTVTPSYVNAQTLAHELGHCLDLFHTYNPSCCHETCNASDPEYLYDLFGADPPAYCWEIGGFGCKITLGKNTCTNNIMGGNNMLNYYFSPMQIGKMHRALSIKSVRKYVKENAYNMEQFKIDRNEMWNFDIRMYSDIVIKRGNVLTLKGKILMADQATIVIKRGATLIVDGGVITSSGQFWQGIKIEGTKNRMKRLFGKKGEVIFKNGGIIENDRKERLK